MNFTELRIRFCGIAGDGVVSSGKILAGACAHIGLNVMVNDIYSAEIRGLGKSTSTVRFSGKKLYSMGDGIDVLYDDRDQRPGVKFNDADLIGNPIRLTISDRSLQSGGIEVKLRDREHKNIIPLDEIIPHVRTVIDDLLNDINKSVVPMPYEE